MLAGPIQHISSVDSGQLQNVTFTAPAVKKQFSSSLNIVTFAFVICNSWAGVSATLQIALVQGGPPALIYGLFVSTAGYVCIALSLSELSSVYPIAGGQYHFASILAPERIKRGISYSCGLLAMLSWVAIGAAVIIIPPQQIMSLVAVYRPDFEIKTWHVFLIYQVWAVAILMYNIFALKKTPWAHNIGCGYFATPVQAVSSPSIVALTLALFLGVTITLLARSTPKAPSDFVWATITNYTGWPDGVCFIIGLSTTCFMFMGLDGAMHIAEECTEPRKAVPMAMDSAVGIGFMTGLTYTIAQLYALTDIQAILNTELFAPVLIFQQGFRSTTGMAIYTALAMLSAVFISNAIQETSSRLAWSFARDNGLVLSSKFAQMHPRLEVPVWSLLLTWVLVVVCGCIFMASKTAFNALIGSAIVLQEISFLIPVALLLHRMRSTDYLPTNRRFKLPSWLGWTANIVTVIFGTVTTVFFCLPAFLPVTPDTMNYTSVILGIASVLGLVNWFLHASKHYEGPTIKFAEDESG